jgi:hypothetical protein
MLEHRIPHHQPGISSASPAHFHRAAEAYHYFQQARQRGWWFVLWSWITRSPTALTSLRDVEARCKVAHRRFIGTRSVLISLIRGSEGRIEDFDAAFNPRRLHSRQRWSSIAMAWKQGITLPPVDLIQVGDSYFVRDGHHRVSVLKAMGQAYIDAQVTAWEVAETAPCLGIGELQPVGL